MHEDHFPLLGFLLPQHWRSQEAKLIPPPTGFPGVCSPTLSTQQHDAILHLSEVMDGVKKRTNIIQWQTQGFPWCEASIVSSIIASKKKESPPHGTCTLEHYSRPHPPLRMLFWRCWKEARSRQDPKIDNYPSYYPQHPNCNPIPTNALKKTTPTLHVLPVGPGRGSEHIWLLSYWLERPQWQRSHSVQQKWSSRRGYKLQWSVYFQKNLEDFGRQGCCQGGVAFCCLKTVERNGWGLDALRAHGCLAGRLH